MNKKIPSLPFRWNENTRRRLAELLLEGHSIPEAIYLLSTEAGHVDPAQGTKDVLAWGGLLPFIVAWIPEVTREALEEMQHNYQQQSHLPQPRLPPSKATIRQRLLKLASISLYDSKTEERYERLLEGLARGLSMPLPDITLSKAKFLVKEQNSSELLRTLVIRIHSPIHIGVTRKDKEGYLLLVARVVKEVSDLPTGSVSKLSVVLHSLAIQHVVVQIRQQLAREPVVDLVAMEGTLKELKNVRPPT